VNAKSDEPIGYVETVRDDLLDAAWRSTMSPMRARRRRPPLRWVVAGATVLTLLAAGGVGWFALSSGRSTIPSLAAGPVESRNVDGPAAISSSTPAPASAGEQQKQFGSLTESATGNQGVPADETSGAASPVPEVASINPAGDLSKVIRTASLSIVVGHDTFGDRFTSVGDIADRLGGYVSSSSTSGGRSGNVTMRVPARHFQDALRSLRGVGRVEDEDIRGKEVSAQYVDLTARRRIALARRRVLFGLMDKAVSIEQTIRVQNALDDVQLRIEELEGQINVLSDRISEATINVSMRETGVTAGAETNVENPSIPGAFDRAVAGFFSVVAAVIVGLGWIIPAIVVLAGIWFVVTRVRRRLFA
jgi:hypothetical protein